MTGNLDPPDDTRSDAKAVKVLLLKNLSERLDRLEEKNHKTIFQRLTDLAGVSALFLGLVLTFGSLRDVFWIKPEADRIARLSEFSQAVNLAAKTRQELLQAQMQNADPKLQLALGSSATPQILNDITTARKMLRDIDNEDIEIPQLIVLISESFTDGDLAAAKVFIDRAVNKEDSTPYLKSEAHRYKARYLYMTGHPDLGKVEFEASAAYINSAPGSASALAFVLGDYVIVEYTYGDCDNAERTLKRFSASVNSSQVPPFNRSQMMETVKYQINQLQNQHCRAPENWDVFSKN